MQCIHTNKELIPWKHSNDFLFEPCNKVLYYQKWKPLNYNKEYFFEEYKKTYGKTYLEDEENIRLQSRKRLNWLKFFLKNHNSLLELGCALGFFLDESKKYFNLIEGVEISEYACDYAKEKFHLRVNCTNLLDFIRINRKKYDVIASFFVIEHFKQQKEIFSFISNSLNPNGIWIASLPSTNGPLFEFHKEIWIQSHPQDHFVDYHPTGLRQILKLYNLKLQSIRPVTYHQERAKGILRKIPFYLFRWYSNLFSYGDTIEFIAIKK